MLVLVLVSGRPPRVATAAAGRQRCAHRPRLRRRRRATGARDLRVREARVRRGARADPRYAHHPGILAGYGALEYATEKADRVPADLKALAATKAAAMAGCEFCMDIGSMISTEHGVTEAQLRALPEHATSDEFSEVEKLVLDFAVGMTRTPVEVPDELFARLREHFDEGQLVELANEIAVENYRARFNWAFGIGSQGFTGEGFCVRPEVLQSRLKVAPSDRAPKLAVGAPADHPRRGASARRDRGPRRDRGARGACLARHASSGSPTPRTCARW